MKRVLVILFICLFVVACGATLKMVEFDATGKIIRNIETKDYVIKTPNLAALPVSSDLLSRLIDGTMSYFTFNPFKPTPPNPVPPVPAPVPVPVPAPPNPTPYPAPGPSPNPIPAPVPAPVPPAPVPTPTLGVFSQSGNTITLDLGNVPSAMNKVGVPGGANEMWYSLAHVYAYGPGREMVSELAAQNPYRQKIFDWFMAETMKVVAALKANPALSLIAISNDGKDRCGFRLGPAILEVMARHGLGGRSQLGNVMSPDDY